MKNGIIYVRVLVYCFFDLVLRIWNSGEDICLLYEVIERSNQSFDAENNVMPHDMNISFSFSLVAFYYSLTRYHYSLLRSHYALLITPLSDLRP